MPTFVVQLANKKTGRTHNERIEAVDHRAVVEQVDLDDFMIGSVTPIASDALVTPAKSDEWEGRGYARAANRAAVASLFFVPAAIAAFIMAGFALERSRGKYGGFAVGLSLFTSIAWALVVLMSPSKFIP